MKLGLCITLARNLEKNRRERGLSQKDVSERLHITQSSYSAWERGASIPTLDKLVALADFYEISLDDLCGRSDINAATGFTTQKDVLAAVLNLAHTGAELSTEKTVDKETGRKWNRIVIRMPKGTEWLTKKVEDFVLFREAVSKGVLPNEMLTDWQRMQLNSKNDEPPIEALSSEG